MADQPEQFVVTDPDNISEISCEGPINVFVTGDRAVLTFAHVRPETTALFKEGTITPIAVVRARIIITIENLNALRDLLNRLAQPGASATPSTAGGSTRH
jgi:hypothetical protein